MDDNRCAEDYKRQYLQQPLIPESIVRQVRDVERMLKLEYISAEQARKYLDDIEKELQQFHPV